MKKRIGIIITLVYFFLQAFSLPWVGMTWDEPSSFFFGRTALHFYLTQDRGYVTDSEYKNSKRFGKDPFQYIYGEDVYPPFPFVIGSLTSYIFAEHLHLMSSEVAHHLGLVLLGSIGVYAIYGIGIALGWSSGIAIAVSVIYATYPTIVGQMRNDAKDVPLMSMIVLFVFMTIKFLQTYKQGGKNNIIWGIGTGVGLGLAIASKPTAAILVPIFGLWFAFSYIFFRKFRQGIGPIPRLLPCALFIGGLSLVIFYLSWPWIWDNPITKLVQVWTFFKVVGREMPTLYLGEIYKAGKNLPWHYPFGVFAFQTPMSVLIIGVISILVIPIVSIRKKNPWPLLFFFWIVIGMGRFFVPGILIYAKVRHFIDVLPAFFVAIGIVLHEIDKRLHFLRVKQVMVVLIATMIFQQVWIIATHFPYEPSFFNSLIGGTRTVADKKLFDIEYWASSVKDGMKYIEENTSKDRPATVYACSMAHLALFYETPNVRVTKNPVGATYTLVPNSASWFGAVASFMHDNHDLVYTVKRSGGDLLWVFKHRSFSGWNCGSETNMVYER